MHARTHAHIAVRFFPLDVIGLCPPKEYEPPIIWTPRTNPYWSFYGPGQFDPYSTPSSDEEYNLFAATDATTSDTDVTSGDSITSLLDISSPPFQSLFFSGEEGDDDMRIGEISADNPSPPALDYYFSNSNSDDPFSQFHVDENNQETFDMDMNLDSNFLAMANDFGGGGDGGGGQQQQDYSLFDSLG